MHFHKIEQGPNVAAAKIGLPDEKTVPTNWQLPEFLRKFADWGIFEPLLTSSLCQWRIRASGESDQLQHPADKQARNLARQLHIAPAAAVPLPSLALEHSPSGAEMIFDPLYLLFIAPPLLLGLFAQWRVKSTFASMSQVPARMSGAQAARQMLDSAGLHQVGIEPVPGHLSDHYDPRAKVLRLSQDVYSGRSMAALGVACHEAGHAFQDAKGYAPLTIRNMAVPIANFGGSIGVNLAFFGLILSSFSPTFGRMMLLAGIVLFAGVVFFQIVNLPVEFDASARARQHLVSANLISANEEHFVAKVLNAAALTYVAGTLQAIMTLLYFVVRFMGDRR